MSKLADENIRLSKKGDPAIDETEAADLLARLPGWEIRNQDGVDTLVREFRFKNYLMVLDLSNKFGHMGEQVNHHPKLVTEWGKVTVQWWTHVIGGLHRNDFIMAARCDRVAKLISAP